METNIKSVDVEVEQQESNNSNIKDEGGSFFTLLNLIAAVGLAYAGAGFILGKPGLVTPVIVGAVLGFLVYGRETMLKIEEQDAPKLAQLFGAVIGALLVVTFFFGLGPISLVLASGGFAAGMSVLPLAELSDGRAIGSPELLRSFVLALTSLGWWQTLGAKAKSLLLEAKETVTSIPAKIQGLVTPQSLGEDE